MPHESSIRTGPRSTAFTADFTHELAAETGRLLHGRYLWFAGAAAGVWTLQAIAAAIRLIQEPSVLATGALGFELVAVAAYLATLLAVTRGQLRTHDLRRLTIWMVVVDTGIRVVMDTIGLSGGLGWAGSMLIHILAASFLPWTILDAVKSALLMIVVVIIDGFALDPLVANMRFAPEIALLNTCGALLWGLPGIIVAWAKYSRRIGDFRVRFFQKKYGELRRELIDARRIHESLFPVPSDSGPLRFRYRYEPMRQIGGDFLFAMPNTRPGEFSFVLIDVTGHGIPAALTVNRLHGELERLFAEDPEIAPGEVLRLLNRYVHLTLARHSVYLTAFCARVNTRTGHLEYASGGHPPAFVRTVDKRIHELNSTTFVLGAAAGEDFEPAPQSMSFGPGDVLIAYTDGAIEARDQSGKMLGVQGLARVVASTPPERFGWAEHLLRYIENHRFGPPADDTLIVEVGHTVSA